MSFEPFGKITRLTRECVITEKIDGTNAQVLASYDERAADVPPLAMALTEVGPLHLWAGSRSRFITKADDNHGFARWVCDHVMELAELGAGRHFGEWWGQGIQRGYGLKEKRFSLFNVSRWEDDTKRPACCHVVPVLYRGMFDTGVADEYLEILDEYGSAAAIGFMKPEGIIVFHVAGNLLFKKTILKDDEPKGEKGREAA